MKRLTVSGGVFKNHKIKCPPGEIRPVMRLVREAIFQIIHNNTAWGNVSGNMSGSEGQELGLAKNFLDLFSGSGLMSIEAISHGFETATAVELDKKKWSVIYDNIAVASPQIQLSKDSAEKFLLRNTALFHTIYADPPFHYKYKTDLIKKIIKSRACGASTMIIIHTPKKEPIIDAFEGFVKYDTRNYGGSAVHFFCQPDIKQDVKPNILSDI